MPFNVKQHVTAHVERMVGMSKANITIPRKGDRTKEGENACDMMCSFGLMSGFTKQEGLTLWDTIEDNAKDAPPDVATAKIISKVAQIADVATPQGCLDELQNEEEEPDPVVCLLCPGSPMFFGKKISAKFISYLYLNMDPQTRVKWPDLTGREQYEWYEAWLRSGRGYERDVVNTRGLCGTDMGRIPDLPALETAMTHAASVAKRRPDNHVIGEDVWSDAARRLTFME